MIKPINKTRITVILYLSLIFFNIYLIIYAINEKNYPWMIWGSVILIISFSSWIINKYYTKIIPYSLEFLIISAFIFHLIHGLYDFGRYHFIFNKFTHFYSSMIFAFIILISLSIFYELNGNVEAFTYYKISFDVIVITMAFGVIWEFLEWISDMLFDLNSQPGLNDTMFDLLADTLGGIFIALIGFFLIKNGYVKKITNELNEKIRKRLQ